ncbi:MAG: hypothetical protein D4R82_01495 [Dehalococcoidia bacterium]|nr:MAG: hypothetical protein D4R82_01495 [Dehalococcoidia bacterium]
MRQGFFKKGAFLEMTLVLVLLAALVACAPSAVKPAVFPTTQPTAVAPGYEVGVLVPGSYGAGFNGLDFDSQDNLYVGGVSGYTIYKVTIEDGQVQLAECVGPPEGQSDDLAFGPDGGLYWTSYLDGVLRCKIGDEIKVLAEGLLFINAVGFNDEGRLFVTQSVLADALWEMDPKGVEEPRLIAKDIGAPNAFDFGPDGKLYTPLYHGGAVVRIDVNTGEIETVADGFEIPVAVNFDSKGNLYVLDNFTGEFFQIDTESGEKKLIVQLVPTLDNFAFNSRDELFVSSMDRGGVYRVDTKTGEVETWVEANLTSPGGITVAGETVYVADTYSLRQVDGNTGEVRTLGILDIDGLNYPLCVSVKGDSAFVSSFFMGLIQEFDLKSQQVVRTFTGFVAPYDMLQLDDGSILVAELGKGRLIRVSGDEGENREVVADGLGGPMGLAFAGKNKVYVTETVTGDVSRVDVSTGEKEVLVSGLQMPKGIAVEADGKILVIETGLHRLIEIDPESGAILPLVEDLAVGVQLAKILPATGTMNGVAVSDSGAIYVSGEAERVLYKITHK